MADVSSEMEYGYREVIPNQTISPKRRDINVNIGAAQGTLQDIKRPEACGGYAYKDSTHASKLTRNRFFYWRISHDILEISEESLDLDLTGNHICLRFHDTPVLDGVGVHENGKNVVFLVATVSSVHRIILPHPNKQDQDSSTLSFRPISIPSVLAEITAAQVREPSNSYVLNWSGAPGTLPHSSSCWLSVDGEAHFALACSVGSILLVNLPRPDTPGSVVVRELRHSTMMQRVWTGIVPSIMRGGTMASDAPVSLCFHALDKILALFVLCRDSKIRMWSIKDHDCIMVCDLMHFVSDFSSSQKLQHMGQRHVLRKAVGTRRNELLLGAFLHFVDRSQFLVLQLVIKSGNYDLEYVSSFYSPEFDLTDFSLTPHLLWALWTNVESEPVLRYAVVNSAVAPSSGWNNVHLEPPVGRDFHLPEGLMDPREAYCRYIFYPGRFSLQTITKAINIYRRSADLSCLSEINASSSTTLYEEVTTTVEMEIQNRASEYELSDEQYIQLQQECWSKFYLSCIQYHQVGTKPMGLCSDPNSGAMCLIKKNTFSLLRPCDILEQLALSSDERNLNEFITIPALQDAILSNDLVVLFRCLHLIRSQLSAEIIHDFRYDLFHLMTPEMISQNVVDMLLLTSGENEQEISLLNHLTDILQSMNNLMSTIQTLLVTIDLAHGAPQDFVIDNYSAEVSRRLLTNKLFGSKLGSSVLAETVHQIAEARFDMCRDLMIFLELVIRGGIQVGISGDIRQTIRSNLVPQTSVSIQAYFLLTWFCETTASSTSVDIVDSGTRQLAILNLSETSYGESKSVQPVSHSLRLVELFIQGDGGSLSRILLAEGNVVQPSPCRLWMKAFLPFVTIVSQLVWPITVNFMFPEFLMAQCQYTQLQEYVRLLQPWCEWNSCSRKFLCGYTHLIQGDPDKALDWFLAAVNDISQEDFIVSKVLQASDVDPSQLNILYFLKVIRLFEQYLHAEHVVILARIAIDNSEKDSSHLPTLGTLLFKYLLELGHNNDAYAAMMAIPDHSRKKDCLRQFIVVLFERHELKALVEYPYPDMLDEVIEIIESRARTIDLNIHNYYELLYSCHVYRGNFRRAGSVMYEYGMRLGNEVGGLKGLQKQAKCYLAAMNCLHLVDPRYAWIVKPVPVERSTEVVHPGMSPKRSSDGEEIIPSAMQNQVVLVELNQIRNEYELVLARLRLVKRNPDPLIAKGPAYTAEESVLLLCNAGLFDVAIRICKTFKISLESVFEALTTRCIHLMKSIGSVPNAADEAWDWLMENETSGLHFSRESSIVDHVWRLLSFYVDTYEEKGQVVYHRCIINRLLSNACSLPNWLLATYKEYDVADLLRQYLKFEMLEQAAGLVIEYLDAVLGKGKEYFGLQSNLSQDAPPVWVPYTAIDNLMEMMALATDKDPSLTMLQDALIVKLAKYHCQVENVSKAMLKNARPRLQIGQTTN